MSTKAHKLFEPSIVKRAIIDSFLKLNPRHQIRNPVMFVVFVGSLLTTALIFVGELGITRGFIIGVTLWLWFTLLFANFAEAMAEGRGKAQADSLRASRRDVTAKLLAEPHRGAKQQPTSAATLRTSRRRDGGADRRCRPAFRRNPDRLGPRRVLRDRNNDGRPGPSLWSRGLVSPPHGSCRPVPISAKGSVTRSDDSVRLAQRSRFTSMRSQADATRSGFAAERFPTTSRTTLTNSGTSSLVDCCLYASAMCMSMCGSAGVTGRSTIADVE